jgi:hypothetical protein
MAFNFTKIDNIDNKWNKGEFISSLEDFEQIEDTDDPPMVAWFSVKQSPEDTKQEDLETRQAIQYQITNNIIKPNGMPVGFPDPPPKKINKWERKRQRLIDRQIEKDMRKKK